MEETQCKLEDQNDSSKVKELFLDTKRTCFLCLQEQEEESAPAGGDGWNDVKLNPGATLGETSYRSICRFLKIHPQSVLLKTLRKGNFINEGETVEECSSPEKIKCDFSVLLCSTCSFLTINISELVNQIEVMKMLMDHQIQVFHQVLQDSFNQKDSFGGNLWRNLQEKICDSPVEVLLVEHLREETIEKCSKVVKHIKKERFPKVVVNKLPTKSSQKVGPPPSERVPPTVRHEVEAYQVSDEVSVTVPSTNKVVSSILTKNLKVNHLKCPPIIEDNANSSAAFQEHVTQNVQNPENIHSQVPSIGEVHHHGSVPNKVEVIDISDNYGEKIHAKFEAQEVPSNVQNPTRICTQGNHFLATQIQNNHDPTGIQNERPSPFAFNQAQDIPMTQQIAVNLPPHQFAYNNLGPGISRILLRPLLESPSLPTNTTSPQPVISHDFSVIDAPIQPHQATNSSGDMVSNILSNNYEVLPADRYLCKICHSRFQASKIKIYQHLINIHPECLFTAIKSPHFSDTAFHDCCKQLLVSEAEKGLTEAKKKPDSDLHQLGYLLCPLCRQNYSNGLDFRYHFAIKHHNILEEKLIRLQKEVTNVTIDTDTQTVKLWTCSNSKTVIVGCGKRMASKDSLIRHQHQSCPNRKNKTVFMCSLKDGGCGKIFASILNVKRHRTNNCCHGNRKWKYILKDNIGGDSSAVAVLSDNQSNQEMEEDDQLDFIPDDYLSCEMEVLEEGENEMSVNMHPGRDNR